MLFTLEGMPGKQLQLLREMKPGLSRVAVIVVTSEALSAMLLQKAETAATLLGITLVPIEIRTRNDWDAAFKTMRQRMSRQCSIYPRRSSLRSAAILQHSCWQLECQASLAFG